MKPKLLLLAALFAMLTLALACNGDDGNGNDNGDDGTSTRAPSTRTATADEDDETRTPDEDDETETPDEDDETETPDDGDNGGDGDVESYYSELEGLATDVSERLDEAGNREPPAEDDLEGQKEYILEIFGEQSDILDEAVGDLEDLDVPGEVSSLHDDFVSALRDEVEAINDLIGQVEDTDAEELEAFFTDFDFESITADATAACTALEADAIDRGLSVFLDCG
jgi:hypothetical protein